MSKAHQSPVIVQNPGESLLFLSIYRTFGLENNNWLSINGKFAKDPNKTLKKSVKLLPQQSLTNQSFCQLRVWVIETTKRSQFDQRDTTSGSTAIPTDFTLNQTGPGAKRCSCSLHSADSNETTWAAHRDLAPQEPVITFRRVEMTIIHGLISVGLVPLPGSAHPTEQEIN